VDEPEPKSKGQKRGGGFKKKKRKPVTVALKQEKRLANQRNNMAPLILGAWKCAKNQVSRQKERKKTNGQKSVSWEGQGSGEDSPKTRMREEDERMRMGTRIVVPPSRAKIQKKKNQREQGINLWMYFTNEQKGKCATLMPGNKQLKWWKETKKTHPGQSLDRREKNGHTTEKNEGGKKNVKGNAFAPDY